MERTLTGVVKVRPQGRTSQAGNQYAQFVIEADGKPYKVLAFGNSCEPILERVTEVNVKLILHGKIQEQDFDQDSPPTMFLDSFSFADKDVEKKIKKKKGQDSIITQDYKDMMARKGLVYASFGKGQRGWNKKKDSVKIGDKWFDQLCFIMLMLGEELVMKLLKEEQVGIFENLKHYGELKKNMLGLAITDYKAGKRPWLEGE